MPGDAERGVEDHNVMCSGMTHRLSFLVPGRGSIAHNFATCFLSPGLYQVYPCEVNARTQGGVDGHLETLTAVEEPKCSVRPAYILVQ